MLDMFIASAFGFMNARAVMLRGLSMREQKSLGHLMRVERSTDPSATGERRQPLQNSIVGDADEELGTEGSGNFVGEERADGSAGWIDSSKQLALVPPERLCVVAVSRSGRPLRRLGGEDSAE